MKNTGPDLYGILHIAPTATAREEGRAYRTLMRCRHPDTRLLPAASLLIGPVIREPPAGRTPGMPARQRSYPPTGYTLILQIRR